MTARCIKWLQGGHLFDVGTIFCFSTDENRGPEGLLHIEFPIFYLYVISELCIVNFPMSFPWHFHPKCYKKWHSCENPYEICSSEVANVLRIYMPSVLHIKQDIILCVCNYLSMSWMPCLSLLCVRASFWGLLYLPRSGEAGLGLWDAWIIKFL